MESLTEKVFQQRWVTAPSIRQTMLLLNLNRGQLRMVTGLISSHCHMYMLRIHLNPACRGYLEDEETPGNVLGDCLAFSRFRPTHLGQPLWVRPNELREQHPISIVRFIESVGLYLQLAGRHRSI